jgi:hypothetical protein
MNNDAHRAPPSNGELQARAAVERRAGRALSDEEWSKWRRRLLEFAVTLARWDREQRKTPSAVENEDRKLAS